MPVVVKRTKKYFGEDSPVKDYDTESELLRTIKFSNNVFKLKLPKANYE